MEPPTNLPRRAVTLTRLWRSTDARTRLLISADGEHCNTPEYREAFERDKWRSLTPRCASAAARGGVQVRRALGALQMARRDSYHFREDWADKARFSEDWTMSVYRYPVGEPEGVDYTATVSPGTLVLDRRTPKNSTSVATQFDISRVGDRCCVHRFRVALTYTRTTKGLMVVVAVFNLGMEGERDKFQRFIYYLRRV